MSRGSDSAIYLTPDDALLFSSRKSGGSFNLHSASSYANIMNGGHGSGKRAVVSGANPVGASMRESETSQHASGSAKEGGISTTSSAEVQVRKLT